MAFPIDAPGAQRGEPGESRLEWADRGLRALESKRGVFPRDALDRIVEALDGYERAALESWLERRGTGPGVAYLHIQLLGGDAQQVADRWERIVSAVPNDAALLLEAAHASARAGSMEAASRQLRVALQLRPPYALVARAAALVDGIRAVGHAGHVREARIALLGGSTTTLLAPVLRALCFRDRIAVDIHETPFGAYRQEVLDSSSRLFRFEPTVAFVVTSWRDLALPPFVEDEDAAVERIVAESERVWTMLTTSGRCHVVQHAFDFPAAESHDYTAAGPRGRLRVLERVNLELARRAPVGVAVLDQASVQREVGLERWQDDRLWHTARQHPSPAALPALAELQMAHLRAVSGMSKKVVVCDLDNTLWGGVIGEDGLEGIRLGPDSPAGEAHQALQDYLRELRARGVLLAVCSKNNLADARLPFERHPHTRLRMDDFAAFVANWDDKASNLHALARELALGVDSFVVLDDNPFERAWMRAQVPEATVVELGPAASSWTRDLDRGRYFFSLSLTDEDRRRHEQYRANAAVRAQAASYESLDDFLAQLEMRAVAAPITSATMPRVVQLIGKTNQFNLTGRRHQRQDVERILAKPGAWSVVVSLSDRLANHGLISVVICDPVDPQSWEIDTWVMSCRVLGRGLERFVMHTMIEAARARGVKKVIGLHRPTERNGLVGTLFDQLGFTPIPNEDDAERRFVRRVDDERPLLRHHIATGDSAGASNDDKGHLAPTSSMNTSSELFDSGR